MYPIIAQIGSFSITALGLFLSLALLLATFVVWRISRVYDLDREQTLDLVLLTFFSGLFGARFLYILFNLSYFDSPLKMVLFNLYPGFSLWGGLFFGTLMLYLLTRRFRLDFFLIADIAAVGFVVALALTSIGCFFGGCQYGLPSDLFIAISQVGILGKRFPVQILFAICYFIAFLYLWKMCLKFHFAGRVLSSALILIGIINFTLQFLRGEGRIIYSWITLEHLLALSTILVGSLSYYKLSRRSFITDVIFLIQNITSSKVRNDTLFKLSKKWYNLRINLQIYLAKKRLELLKILNVKSNPTQF